MATMTEPESGKLQLDCEEEEAVDFALLRNPSELAGARYVPAVFSPSEHADLFEQARSIEFSAVNRGITRGPGAPRVHAFTRARRSCREKFSEEGWPLFVQRIIDRLRHVGILQASSNEPDQVSVNHYASSDYNMVPHRDGYVMQVRGCPCPIFSRSVDRSFQGAAFLNTLKCSCVLCWFVPRLWSFP